MPRLRVIAGPSLDDMQPMSANNDEPFTISTPYFEGKILAYIKGFPNEDGELTEHEYFEREDRAGVTWSIQFQGRFLQEICADDILFGNTFDRPLQLPWGSSAALKFMKYRDPTMDHDLSSQTKPWALSPLISSMPHLHHTRGTPPPFPATDQKSLSDDVTQLHLARRSRAPSRASSSASIASLTGVKATDKPDELGKRARLRNGASRFKDKMNGEVTAKDDSEAEGTDTEVVEDVKGIPAGDAAARRAYFADAARRKEIFFGPEDIITSDFCHGYLSFTPSVTLNLPGGISFDLLRFWDGQPVRFTCCERKRAGAEDGDAPWGRVFFSVAIESVAELPAAT
ncbi:DUF1769-domain-containing protein [Peniophora sp. CONT]|nr:DUF1769-domain-containing protein [Peniophora sp. CONT]